MNLDNEQDETVIVNVVDEKGNSLYEMSATEFLIDLFKDEQYPSIAQVE